MGNSSTKASKLSSDSDKYETPHGSPSLKRKSECPSETQTDSTRRVSDSFCAGSSLEPVNSVTESGPSPSDSQNCENILKKRLKKEGRKLDRPRSLLSVPAFLRIGIHKSSSHKSLGTRSVPTSTLHTPKHCRDAGPPLSRQGNGVQKLNEDVLTSSATKLSDGGDNSHSVVAIHADESTVPGQDTSDASSSASSTGSGFIFIVDSAANSSQPSVPCSKSSQETDSKEILCPLVSNAAGQNEHSSNEEFQQSKEIYFETPSVTVTAIESSKTSLPSSCTSSVSTGTSGVTTADGACVAPKTREMLDDDVPCFTTPFGPGAQELYSDTSLQAVPELIAPLPVESENSMYQGPYNFHQVPEISHRVLSPAFDVVPSRSSPNIQCYKRDQRQLTPPISTVLGYTSNSREQKEYLLCDLSDNHGYNTRCSSQIDGRKEPFKYSLLRDDNEKELVCPASLLVQTSRPRTVYNSKSMGRVHSATCSAINPVTRTATVEWFEKGDTKGKEVDFDAVFSLNPDLAPQNQAEFKHPGALPKHHAHVPHTTDADEDEDDQTSTSDGELSDYVAPPPSHSMLGRGPATRASGRLLRNSQSTSNAAHLLRPYGASQNMSPLPSQLPRGPPVSGVGLSAAQVARSQSASRLTMHSRNVQPGRTKDASNQPRQSYVSRSNVGQQNGAASKIAASVPQPARSIENIAATAATVSKGATQNSRRRSTNVSSVVKEVDRIQRNREERRMKQAIQKEEKEALMNIDPNNPNWEFQSMIREFRQTLEFRTLRDGDALEEHQITVAVRKRPLNKKEVTKKEVDVVTIPKKDTLIVHEPRTKVDLTKYLDNQNFRFDYAFDDSCSNELVYKYTARPLVCTIFEGGMATCFAYGQTGSGKTHTMGGEFQGKSQDVSKGIYAMAARDVFSYLSSKKFAHLNLQVSASFFEIYSGKVFDLLNGKNKLRVLEDGKQVVQVVGLVERVCLSPNDVLQLIQLGSSARTSGQTAANNQSSRSHAVFQIILRNTDRIDKAAGVQNYRLHGKFSLIDLAGNERGADTSSANRQTRMESAEINKSLLALKECIRALGKRGAHLPFRASKLTQVLRDSFIGEKSKTCMIAMISPGLSSCEHTLNTLRYADRVKELGASDGTEDGGPKASPDDYDPEANGGAHADYSRLTSFNEGEMSAEQQVFQVAMSAVQEAEEEVVELHGQYFAHRDNMDKMLIPLYQMTNEIDYDVDAYAQQLEGVVNENIEWWQLLKEKVVKLRRQLEEEEKIHNQHVPKHK